LKYIFIPTRFIYSQHIITLKAVFNLEVVDMAGNTGGSLEKYRTILRKSQIEDQNALLGLHALAYVVVNAVWILLVLNLVPSRYRWIAFYPVVGWGLLVFIHWWFYVRNVDKLCKFREERALAGPAEGGAQKSF
jgi:hypothetical protein